MHRARGHAGYDQRVHRRRAARSGGARRSPSPSSRSRQRLQQLSGPATAKGVEDTALYVYVPLASRNEVGGAPDRPLDDAVAALPPRQCAARRAIGRSALVTTNTHDAKRSADVRARLAALSEMPHGVGARGASVAAAERQASSHGARTRRAGHQHRIPVLSNARRALARSARRLAAPTISLTAPGATRRERVSPSTCARRRAKRRSRTSWIEPDADYERALDELRRRGARAERRRALSSGRRSTRVASSRRRRASNTLRAIGAASHVARAQPTSIRAMSSGTSRSSIPTTAGRWITTRAPRALADLSGASCGAARRGAARPVSTIVSSSRDASAARVSALTRRPLHARRVSTARRARSARRHVVAFARTFEGQTCMTIVGRLLAGSARRSMPDEWWADTSVDIPAELDSPSLAIADCRRRHRAAILERFVSPSSSSSFQRRASQTRFPYLRHRTDRRISWHEIVSVDSVFVRFVAVS